MNKANMVQVKLFSEKTRNGCEEAINTYLKDLGDVTVQIEYVPTLSYYEACIIYGSKNPYKRKPRKGALT